MRSSRSSFHCNIKLLRTDSLMQLTYITSHILTSHVLFRHVLRLVKRRAGCVWWLFFCWLTWRWVFCIKFWQISLFEAELVLVPSANVEETVRHVLWRQEDDEELQKAFQGDLSECNAI